MTCTYDGITYDRGELWKLCAALDANGLSYAFGGRDENWRYVACIMSNSADRGTTTLAETKGDPGDRTPWKALCRAVEKMEDTGDE